MQFKSEWQKTPRAGKTVKSELAATEADDIGNDEADEETAAEPNKEPGQQVPDEDPRPKNRKEFNELRKKYKNRFQMAFAFLSERDLQVQIRMIVQGLEYFHEEYSIHLNAHKLGQTNLAIWSGLRSQGKYMADTVRQTMNLLSSESVMLDFGLTPCFGVPLRIDAPMAQAESKLAKLFFNFIVDLSANRVWSQMHFQWCMPYACSQFFLPSKEHKRVQFALKKLTQAILKLERACMDQPKNAKLQALHQRLATNGWPYTRELMAQGESCDWDLQNQDLRDLVYAMVAGPSQTKTVLEDTFGWLQDSAQRQSKAFKMSIATRNAYSMICPYPAAGGCPQVAPSKADFTGLTAQKALSFFNLKPFDSRSTSVPVDSKGSPLMTAELLQNHWRKAGFYANREGAAASAFIFMFADSNFASLEKIWAGYLLAQNHQDF